jgi:hypothetical protein
MLFKTLCRTQQTRKSLLLRTLSPDLQIALCIIPSQISVYQVPNKLARIREMCARYGTRIVIIIITLNIISIIRYLKRFGIREKRLMGPPLYPTQLRAVPYELGKTQDILKMRSCTKC